MPPASRPPTSVRNRPGGRRSSLRSEDVDGVEDTAGGRGVAVDGDLALSPRAAMGGPDDELGRGRGDRRRRVTGRALDDIDFGAVARPQGPFAPAGPGETKGDRAVEPLGQ